MQPGIEEGPGRGMLGLMIALSSFGPLPPCQSSFKGTLVRSTDASQSEPHEFGLSCKNQHQKRPGSNCVAHVLI